MVETQVKINCTFRNAVVTIWDRSPIVFEGEMRAKLRFFAYGEEITPTTNKEHRQAYAQAWKPMRLRAWLKCLPAGSYVDIMRGVFKENEGYCSKENELVKFGVEPNEDGVKKTTVEFKKAIDNGKRPLEVAEDEEMFPTYLQYRSGFEAYSNHIRKKAKQLDRDMPKVYVRVGRAGTGKTRWMDETFGLDGWVMAPDNTGKWFDGCDRDVILFDDVDRDSIMSLSLWKRLCDRYPMQVPIKGGFITWKPKVIVFTSNTPPTQWWKDLPLFDQEAIERRCEDIVVVE